MQHFQMQPGDYAAMQQLQQQPGSGYPPQMGMMPAAYMGMAPQMMPAYYDMNMAQGKFAL
jgi:hypothetical protein